MQETPVGFLGGEDPLEKEMQPTPVFLPGAMAAQGQEGQEELLHIQGQEGWL